MQLIPSGIYDRRLECVYVDNLNRRWNESFFVMNLRSGGVALEGQEDAQGQMQENKADRGAT